MRRQKLNPAPRRNGSGAALSREESIKKANSILKKAERLVPSYIKGEADETDFWKLRDGIWSLEKKSYGNFTGHDCGPYVTKIMRLYQEAEPARRKHMNDMRSAEIRRLREAAYKEQEPYEWMGSTRTFRNPRNPIMTIQGHTVSRIAGGYRVDAYGKTFTTKSACKNWLRGHVAAEKRQLRSRHG